MSLLALESSWIARDSGTTASLWGAVYTSDVGGGTLIAVGEQGTILSSADDGATWTRRDSGTNAWLTAATYDSWTNRFYVVGEGGTILSSTDGVVWVREASPTTVRLNAVSVGPTPGTISAIGEVGAGTLVRGLNGVWSSVGAGFGGTWLRGAFAPYLVGQTGAMFLRTGNTPAAFATSWSKVAVPTNEDLEGVAGGSTGAYGFFGSPDLFSYVAVGANGTIIQSSTTGWGLRPSGTTERLRGICRREGSGFPVITNDVRITIGEYFVVGTNGCILRSADGTSWQSDVSPTTRHLNTVIVAGSVVIAVGDGGTILQTGGEGAVPTITRQPSVISDSTGEYLVSDATGQGALTFLWVQITGGAVVILSQDHPRALIPTRRISPTLPTFPVYQLYVANAFGLVKSVPIASKRFLNLSSRAVVGIGEKKLIGGFTLSGVQPTLARTVLVRAVGPTLESLGVGHPLKVPRLTVFAGTQLLATNTGWQTNPDLATLAVATQRAGAFTLPVGSADSALVLSLTPGNYTAQIESVDGTSGVALVEVYDVDSPTLTHLGNLSTRAEVQSGEAVLIGGLVIDGGAKKKVLLRAAGPALSSFGIQSVLAKPKLTLFRGNAVIATAEAWSAANNVSELRDLMKAAGAFAFAEGSTDAAMVLTLDPGAYTLQVTGRDAGNGVALVEAHELP